MHFLACSTFWRSCFFDITFGLSGWNAHVFGFLELELQHLEPFVFLSPIFLCWVEMEGVGCPSLVHIYNHNYDCPLLLLLYP